MVLDGQASDPVPVISGVPQESVLGTVLFLILSSPEPKAHGELIVYQSSRHPSGLASVRASVNTFKHEYLRNHQVDCNQILSEASLG